MTKREEMLNWTKEKLVDELLKYMAEDEKRRNNLREQGKKWRDKKKAELEELRKFKAEHDK